MNRTNLAIIGAGPYGLSLAAHLGSKNIEHRIFGRPMQFWSDVARAGNERYLKSYCFGTSLSSPNPGFSLPEYNQPRGLETFEPCSMSNFADYGTWFQQNNVAWAEPVDVVRVARHAEGFSVLLANGEHLAAGQVVIATGLAKYATVPAVFASLPESLVIHTSKIDSFAAFKGRNIAIIGAGQSALEAAALLHEAGATPQLLVREDKVRWHDRIPQHGRSLWQQIRAPKSGLGFGPKAWALTQFPSGLNRMPEPWRARFVKGHLPPEGAWWLRDRVENLVPMKLSTTVVEARESAGGVVLRLKNSRGESQLKVDQVIAGSGYDMNIDRLDFVDPALRADVRRIDGSPRLNANFESSVKGFRFIGPISAMSFGPLFRFVAGAEYSAQTVSGHLARQVSRASMPLEVSSHA